MVFTVDFWRQDRSRSALKAGARSMEKSRAANIAAFYATDRESKGEKRAFSLRVPLFAILHGFLSRGQNFFRFRPNFFAFVPLFYDTGNLNNDAPRMFDNTREKLRFIWDKKSFFTLRFIFFLNLFNSNKILIINSIVSFKSSSPIYKDHRV